MANYATAVLNTAKYKLIDMMNKAEFKHKPSSTLMTYLKNTNFLLPASEFERVLATKATDQQSVSVNLLNKQSISTASARAAAHTGAINDSRATTLTFTTYAADFKYSLKGADRNIYSIGEQFAAQLRSAAIALHAAIETAYLARLNTNKSQVVISTTPKSGTWDNTNKRFGVANADENYWMQKVKGFMREQYYNGPYDLIIDEHLFQVMEQVSNQGAGNATNYAFQFSDISAMITQELTLDSGYDGQGYIFPVGGVGVLPWIPEMNRTGFGDVFQNGGLYTTIDDPLGSGLKFAMHVYASGADNEGAAGETQDIDLEVELSIDLAPFEADSSTSNETQIFKIGVLS